MSPETHKIAKPSIFREMEEDDLIGDKLEAKQERKTVEPQSATQSKKALLDEVNAAIWQTLEHELSKSFPEASIKITNRQSDYREVTTDTLTAGRNGWIYCTSIAPETEAEEEALWAGWGAGYTDWYPIRNRRLFARALGGMVIEQLGPRSAESELEGETDHSDEEPDVNENDVILKVSLEMLGAVTGT